MSMRLLFYYLLVAILAIGVIGQANTSSDDPTSTTVPTLTSTSTTPAPTPAPPTTTTGAPQPTPADNPLNDGKKFGISTLVYVCCLIAWGIFLFSYAKIVDHCACCHKKEEPSQKYATTASVPTAEQQQR